jgi:hypothetical protein
MKLTKRMIWAVGLTALIVWVGAANGAQAQDSGFFVEKPNAETDAVLHTALTCKGRVSLVLDAADEAVHVTPAIFGTGPGGGEGGQFDPTPVLTIRGVTLDDDECLNAHLSVIVGSAQTYGVAPLALFQVTLTPSNGTGPPRHMIGHYPTPYGIPSPAVALEAERDVDMLSANFFQGVGPDSEHGVPPGTYDVDVWWAGAPPGVPGGGLGAAFVLKLYLRD